MVKGIEKWVFAVSCLLGTSCKSEHVAAGC